MKMEIKEECMRRALELARYGYGHVSPNPMVGCVIEHNGKIIGEGWHRRFGEAHAEVNAVRSVADRFVLPECTLYVTLEPCAHYGKTPPCADMIAESGVRRVAVGTVDPFSKVAGAGIRRMQEAGIEVVTGVLGDECRDLNRRFFTAHTLRRPYIMLKWAQDAAGNMASSSGKRIRFSNLQTQMLVHSLRAGFDAVITGAGTVNADNPRLDNRLAPGNSPRAVVLDRRGLAGRDSAVFGREGTLAIGSDAPLADILDGLYEDYSVTSALVEAGPTLLNAFLKEGLWDECRIETAPRITEADIPAPEAPRGVLVSSRAAGGNLINLYRKK